MKSLTILTNDPSITAWGWVVIKQNGNILDVGCIKTTPEQKKRRIRKGDDTTRRISEITQSLLQIINKYGVNYILSELPHGSQNAQAAVMIGIVTGIVQTMSDCLNIPVEWYSEMDAKKTLLGKRSASKQETIEKICIEYDPPYTGTKFKDEAIADALAIHYVACRQSNILKMFNF